VTYLADAVAAGARILCRTEAERLHFEGKRATGLDVVIHDESGRSVRRTIRAKSFVLCAGALHTPAILMRSGYAHPHLGTLYLHPTTAVFGRYPEPVKAWEGVPQSRVCSEFDDLDGAGYGARIECAPAHPGLWGMNLPWESAAAHRRLMERLPFLGNLIVLCRDKRPGRVSLGEDGQPLLEYRLHRDDARTLMHGVREALKIERAAGAVELFGPQVHCGSYLPTSALGDEPGFERYLNLVDSLGLPVNACGLYSAHQMGTCRLAATRSAGPVRLDGRMHDLADVFVADGSLLPTPPGVNPMLSILGVSHLLAERMAEKLTARQHAAR
jgi:choline dehydrogenase-like flavoprotein